MTTKLEDYRAHLRKRLVDVNVPDHLHEGLVAYLTERRQTGSFLEAVLSNDLTQAITRADPLSLEGLRETVLFLLNHAPAPAWGSHDQVEAWLSDADPVPVIFD